MDITNSAIRQVVYTHKIGSREIELTVKMTPRELGPLLGEIGSIFRLGRLTWDVEGEAKIQLIPCRGCSELM